MVATSAARVGIGVLFAFLALGVARAEVGGLLTATFPAGEEVCFGRAYDAAHLARHPRQRLSAFHLFKALTPDPQREEAEHPRAVQVAKDRNGEKVGIWSEGARWLSVRVRFRDEAKVYRQEVECTGADGARFYCGRDCDGGGFGATRTGTSLLLAQDKDAQGLRLQTSCDADEEGADIRIDPKEDATAFRLERLPMAACLAERDAARPAFAAAAPLRTRLTRAGVCHGRGYDTVHLARHPQQRVVALTLATRAPVRVEEEDGYLTTQVAMSLSLRLRDGTSAEAAVTCTASDYVFLCARDGASTAFEMIRDGARGLVLRDANFRRREDRQNHLADLLDLPLGDDDRVFRLEPRDDAKCVP